MAILHTPPDSLRLIRTLRAETHKLHREAEHSGLLRELIRGQVTRDQYALLLRSLLPVYESLETAMKSASEESRLARLAMPGIYRSQAIINDLQAICGDEWAPSAGLIAWSASSSTVQRQNLLVVFSLNALLNVLWSLLFFRMHRPDWALYEVGFLWASIVLLMFVCARRRTLAALLLIPYLLWVSFAAVLNAEIVRLNTFSLGG